MNKLFLLQDTGSFFIIGCAYEEMVANIQIAHLLKSVEMVR